MLSHSQPLLGEGTDSLPILWFVEAALVANLIGRESEPVNQNDARGSSRDSTP